MDKPEGNASNLLNSLLGQVTEQQKEIYKKIKYEQGDLVVSEVFSDSGCSDEEDDTTRSFVTCTPVALDTDTPTTSAASSQVVIDYVELAPVQPDFGYNESTTLNNARESIPNSEQQSSQTLQWDSAIPIRYMNGDISFTELTNIMENKLQMQSSTTSSSLQTQLQGGGNSMTRNDDQRSRVVIEEGDFDDATSSFAEFEDDDDDGEEDEEEGEGNDDDDDDDREDKEEDSDHENSASENEDNEWAKAARFEQELIDRSNQFKKKKSSTRRDGGGPIRRKKLAKDLLGLVGQANLHFARGDHEGAIKMCLEVIRLAPTAPEPFQTLGMIYEERREFEKAYQYNLISAYLSPSDGEHWIRVAEMAIDQKQYNQAITCYSKAIKIYPDSVSLYIERSKLYQRVDDKRKALEGYELALDMIIKESFGTNCSNATGNSWQEMGLFIAKEIAKIYYFNGQIQLSISIMEENLKRFHSHIINEDVNLYLELLISDGKFLRALQAFQNYCGVQFRLDEQTVEVLDDDLVQQRGADIQTTLLYTDLQIDLQAKLAVCLIRLRMFASVKPIEQFITKEGAGEMGDLYLDIADAYVCVDRHEDARPFLKALVESSETYNCAKIWLRYARCLSTLKCVNESINAYYEVLTRSEHCSEAKLELSQLLTQAGRDLDAAEISDQPSESEIHLNLLFVRCKLLFKLKQYDQFLVCARRLLCSEITFLRRTEEMNVMITSTTYKTRIESYKEVVKEMMTKRQASLNRNATTSNQDLSQFHPDFSSSEDEQDDSEHLFVGGPLQANELFDTFLAYCKALHIKGHHRQLVRTVLSAYTCIRFTDMERQLDFIALNACYLANDHIFTYALSKAIIFRFVDNKQVWNLFCAIMMRFYQDLRHNRFCLRLFVKHPDNLALAFVNGHNAMMSGSYKHALAEYVNIFKQNQTDPFAILCIGLGFAHLACQKFITNRHSVVVQLCAFLNLYLEIRGECPESLYNIGRSFHQIGLVNEATYFYKKALDCPFNINCSQEDKEELFNLQREIAFNLCLIYRNTESPELVLHVMEKYLTI